MAEVEFFTSGSSPYAYRVEIALKEKKIPYKVIQVDFKNKPQRLLEANPIHKKVPVIIHDGRAVAESFIILEYLEDAFPEQVPLMPKDAFEKSKVRFWADYINQAFITLFKSLWPKPGTPEKQVAIEESVKAIRTLEEGMRNFSSVGPFFAGDKFGVLDCVLAPLCSLQLVFKEVGGVVIPGSQELPRLNKWIEVAKAHPSVSSTLSPEEVPLKFVRAMLADQGAAAAH